MEAQDAIDLVREAIMVAMWVSAPLLGAGMLVGLLLGLLQALTQIQEQTVAFVPKLVAMIAVFTLTLPWAVAHMYEYFHSLFTQIPERL